MKKAAFSLAAGTLFGLVFFNVAHEGATLENTPFPQCAPGTRRIVKSGDYYDTQLLIRGGRWIGPHGDPNKTHEEAVRWAWIMYEHGKKYDREKAERLSKRVERVWTVVSPCP